MTRDEAVKALRKRADMLEALPEEMVILCGNRIDCHTAIFLYEDPAVAADSPEGEWLRDRFETNPVRRTPNTTFASTEYSRTLDGVTIHFRHDDDDAVVMDAVREFSDSIDVAPAEAE